MDDTTSQPTQPITPQSPVATPEQPKKRPMWHVWLGVVITVLICSCCAFGVGANSGKSSTSTQVTAAHTTQPTQAPTEAPTKAPTRNPNASAPVYAALVKGDMDTLTTDMTSVSTDCGNADITACYADLVTLRTTISSIQDDLDTNPAPPCLKSADTYLRTALHDLDTGAKKVIDGIEQNDASMMQEGVPYITQAGTDLNHATAAVNSAHC